MKSGIYSILLIALSALQVDAAPILIDFETFPSGPVPSRPVGLTNQYASLGVTFSAIENSLPVTPTIQDGPSFFGENAFSGTNFANNQILGGNIFNDRADVFRMTFSSPAFAVSFYVDRNGGLNPTFNAYDIGGNLLESISTSANGYQLLSFTSTNIARIDGIQPADDWNSSIDDLRFDLAAEVPEPASLLMWTLGVAGFACYRKRRTGQR